MPLHLACYTGNAPPNIIRALVDAYPNSMHIQNKLGRVPLELATINYHADHPNRAEVLFLLRWHRPGGDNNTNSSIDSDRSQPADIGIELSPRIFLQHPPEQMYMTSTVCIACMEEPSNVVIIPCGHICLCTKCVRTVLRCGKCPVGRFQVVGLHRLEEGYQCSIHGHENESLCCEDGVGNDEMKKCEENQRRMMRITTC